MNTEAPAGTHSSRRINYLLEHLGGRRYLEVGVRHGYTFFAVNAAEKTGVDPRFQFDVASKRSDSSHLFEITSDSYFSALEDRPKFDLIFLDGLHKFEQTFRDFCNSLSCSNNNTIWLIDDTLPNDIYSSCTSEADAVNLRKQETGKPDRSWHGDVYKIVFAIHDFFPMLSYLTINTKGNPQTLVWTQPRKEFRPHFNSLEAISRLSYFEFRRNIGLINRMPEEAGLEAVVNARMAQISGVSVPLPARSDLEPPLPPNTPSAEQA